MHKWLQRMDVQNKDQEGHQTKHQYYQDQNTDHCTLGMLGDCRRR